MNEPRKIRVRSQLSRTAFSGRGVSVQQALCNAEAVFVAMRPPGLEEMDHCLEAIQAAFGPAAPARVGLDLEELYTLSGNIIEASHCLPGSGVEQAARALCALADRCCELGVKDWPAIDVHLRALMLLRASGQTLPESARASILEGLANVTLKRVIEKPSP